MLGWERRIGVPGIYLDSMETCIPKLKRGVNPDHLTLLDPLRKTDLLSAGVQRVS